MKNNDECVYYNLICSEIAPTGGAIIHMDVNKGNMDEVHSCVLNNLELFPNALWTLIPIVLKTKSNVL